MRVDVQILYPTTNIENFIIDYPTHSNPELIKKYDLVDWKINDIARRCNLKKLPETITKARRTYNTIEDVMLAAKKYKSFTAFIKGCEGGYEAANRLNIIHEIQNLFHPTAISTPQLILRDLMDNLLNEKCIYNGRRTIKPYELDLYYPKYKFAFEYNGKHFHKDKKHIDLLKTKLCDDLNILLIHINENTRHYEIDIKNQLIDNIKIINEHCKISINKEQIMNIVIDYNKFIHNKEDIARICNSYNDFKLFKKEQGYIYRKLTRLSLMGTYCKHMFKRKNDCHTLESIKEQIKNIDIMILSKGNNPIFRVIKRNYPELYKEIKDKRNSFEKEKRDLYYKTIMKTYSSISEFRTGNPRAYKNIMERFKYLLDFYL